MNPTRIRFAFTLSMCTVLSCAFAGAVAGEKLESKVDRAKIIETVAPSLVQVEYTLKYDSGDEPSGGGWGEKCPNCGQYHGSSGSGDYVKEERPFTAAGYVIENGLVLTGDIQMHPRFIEKISVRFGDASVLASFAGYAKKQPGTYLKLSEPLAGIRPLTFIKDAKEPHFALTYSDQDARWITHLSALSTNLSVTEKGGRFVSASSSCVIVDGTGAAVGVTMDGVLDADHSWRGSPVEWQRVSSGEFESKVGEIKQKAEAGILRAALAFRSPKKSASRQSDWMDDDESDGEGATQMNVLAVVLDAKRALVLSNLNPKNTARLERITLHGPDGSTRPAKFASTLMDYGAFIVDLEKPADGAIELSQADIGSYRSQLLLNADVEMRGENRIAYYDHRRLASFERRWRGMILPELTGDSDGEFLFEGTGRLLAFNVARRQKVTEKERWGDDPKILLPGSVLKEVLANLNGNVDPNNVPLSEEEENRLAWLGIESQSLSAELARANNVSDKTRDGEIGAMVSFVYPDSPAEKAGVQAGDIIVQLKVEGQPKPLEVTKEESMNMFGGSFPWDKWDDLPEQYFDSIPSPWPSADNTLARSLTELGFGKKFTADVYRDGKLQDMSFVITESPPHYDSAKKYKSEALGLTVRDVTYEVRRYFQMENDAPGVIVSKIEPGSKASVAGLKPYEVITHVADAPIACAADFEKSIEGKTSLRFSVKRMTKGRIVKMKLDKKKAGEAAASDKTAGGGATSQPADTAAE